MRPEQEIALFLEWAGADETANEVLVARRVVAEIPNGTPDSELTPGQRKAWEIIDRDRAETLEEIWPPESRVV